MKAKKKLPKAPKSKSKQSKKVRHNKIKQKLLPEEEDQAPHSFVVRRGVITNSLRSLMSDFRKIMEPFTASTLKAGRNQEIKGFLSVAGMYHVTHLCAFTGTQKGQYLKLCRFSRGPTLTFRIKEYTLATDIVSLQRKQQVSSKQFKYAPLVVLNGFGGEGEHLKLMSTMFQNLFPTINLMKVNLSTIRRCLMLNYDPETRMIDFRHYAIKIVPTDVSKGVKKILQNKVPNLSKFNDISEYMTKSGMLSDSEAEDDPNSHVTLPQQLAFRGANVAEKSGIRLHELGPRMTLQLMKIQEGLMEGEVMYHDIVRKTASEIEATRKRREARRKLKEERKREQALNVRKKEESKALQGMEQRRQKIMERRIARKPHLRNMSTELPESERLMRKAALESEAAAPVSDDDDADWYKKDVGEEPEEDLFSQWKSDKTPMPWSERKPWKKPVLDKQFSNRLKKSMSRGQKKPNRSKDANDGDDERRSKFGGKRDKSKFKGQRDKSSGNANSKKRGSTFGGVMKKSGKIARNKRMRGSGGKK